MKFHGAKIKRKKLKIKPYTKIDGIPTFKDSEIKNLWERVKKEGFADNLFFDMERMDAKIFLEMADKNWWLFVIYEGEEICGFTWLTDLRGGKANAHFALFKEWRGKKGVKIIKQVCIDLLNIGNNNEFLFDVLIGTIPSFNKAACLFVSQIQKEWGKPCSIGTIKKYLYNYKKDSLMDAKVCYFTR